MTPEDCFDPINFTLQDEDMRDSSLRYYQLTVDTTEFLVAKRVQLCLGYGYFDQSAFDAWNYAKNSLSQIAEYAKRKGITLIVEELKETTSNVVNSSAQLARMICELNYDNVVGMMDIDQMAVFGETPDDYFAALGSKLQHIHFNDSGHTAPGDGTLPMKEYYDRIVANNYTGTCSFEICDRRYNIDPDAALDRTIEWFKTNTGIFK